MPWPKDTATPNGAKPTEAATLASNWTTVKSRTRTSETVGAGYTYNDALRMEGDDVAGENGLAVAVVANDGSITYVPDAGTYWFRFADQLPTRARASAVHKGALVTLRGRLSWADWDQNRWRANAGRRVALQYRRAGTSAWVTKGWGRTAADGSVTVTARDRATGSWRLAYGGGILCAPTMSAPIRITVR